jgi:hypothetical protein
MSTIRRRYPLPVGQLQSVSSLERWASSGLMALTGSPDSGLGPPEHLIAGVDRLGHRFGDLDPLALLGERAALLGLSRAGTISCGGGCRLLRANDGWLAVSLVRPDDIGAIPAWLECGSVPEATRAMWDAVASVVATKSVEELTGRGSMLGLPVAALGETPDRPAVCSVPLGASAPRPGVDGLRVLDLTSLWAGPLCGDLLARAGALVVKVESKNRPDGARRGPAAFFDLLNGYKRSVVLDFTTQRGRGQLTGLVSRADVVLESSRPRALQQLGLVASDLVSAGGPRVWVSITGYGRTGPASQRVAFGDDAAVAGGLVVYENGQPRFCSDAIADPLTGLAAADTCLEALEAGGRWMLDVSMAGVASKLSGPTLQLVPGVQASPPLARRDWIPAAQMGSHTAEVLAEFGLPG